MNDTYKKEVIKTEFLTLIKDYVQFPFHDRKKQTEVARELLETACEKTSLYLRASEQSIFLQEILDTMVFGLRQIQRLQDDPDIEEIMINGLSDIFIKRRFTDKHEKTAIYFNSEGELWSVIEKLLEGTGRRVDRSSPLVDTRLPDGSRVNIIISPLSILGPSITIRKFPTYATSADDILSLGTINKQIYDFLHVAVSAKKNILISGATASGKTTLLSALTSFIPGGAGGDRIVLIEETSEIKLPQKLTNKVHLETRPPNIDGQGEYTIADLVKNALRMRPDRIIIGEVRSGEAFDLLQALNTGHAGSLTTLHANSARDALDRLEGMVLMAGVTQLPLAVIRSWIRRSIDLVIHVTKLPGGARKITEIVSVNKERNTNATELHDYRLTTHFSYENNGFVKHNGKAL